MWQFRQFPTGTQQERRWFNHRFGNSVVWNPDNPVPKQFVEVVRTAGSVRYIIRDLENRDNRQLLTRGEIAGWNCGVPKHGWVMRQGRARYLERRFYSKWRWGWRPQDDTGGGAWKGLIEPQFSTMEEFLDPNRRDAVLDYSYAKTDGRNVHFNATRVGQLDQGVLVLEPQFEYVMFDTLIDLPMRIDDAFNTREDRL